MLPRGRSHVCRAPSFLLCTFVLCACGGNEPSAPKDAGPDALPSRASAAPAASVALAQPSAPAATLLDAGAGADAGAPLTADGAIALVLELPEVKAFAAAVERASGGAAHLASWVEASPKPGCSAGSPACRHVLYLGEHHPDHMARWHTAFIDAVTSEIWFADISGAPPVPYEEWRRRLRVSYKDFPEIRRLEGLFPLYHSGRGPLGYGAPDEVIKDIGAWKHAAKAAFAKEGMTITRVELYQDKTYPVFFVKRGGVDLRDLGEHDPASALALARRLLAANASWPYEIAVAGTSPVERYRFRDAPAGGFSRLDGERWSDP